MATDSPEIILHNYPQSPVAEKVRVVFGMKNLPWRSVQIPRVPPKPMLTELTGGYRRTPVVQIGADIYCDSQRIIRELERRFPEPSIVSAEHGGILWCTSRWTDGALFDLGVKIVLGSAGESLPKEFAADRGRLYLGENWAEGLKQANAELPHLVAQLRAPFHWINDQLADGRKFLMGDTPTTIDAQIYHVVWFVRGRWDGGPGMLSEYPALERWEQQVNALGHGMASEMAPEEAIAIAAASEPQSAGGVADGEPQGLMAGEEVTIEPDVNGGEQPVTGKVRAADAESIALDRVSDKAGNLCVLFPRAGYLVKRTYP